MPDDLFNCMVNASWLYGWDECMENTIHDNFHGWHGGAWDCATNRAAFARAMARELASELRARGAAAAAGAAEPAAGAPRCALTPASWRW